MKTEIINSPLPLELYGFEDQANGPNPSETAFRLMNKMWQIVKSNNLPNKGINVWVYGAGGNIFAGVELTEPPKQDTGLQFKTVVLSKYGYHKHIGSYSLIRQAGQQMRAELTANGFEIIPPYIEIYGHHSPDESKTETELLMQLR